MKLLLLVLPLLGTCFGDGYQVTVAKPCPDGWSLLNETFQCFKLVSDRKSWVDAKESCKNMSGHLADILDPQTSTFIGELATNNSDSFWIGLNDLAQEGEFKWLNGRVTIFENWAPGEPNNEDGDENCVHWNQDLWADEQCEIERGFFCQRHAVTKLCPLGWSLLDGTDHCFEKFSEPLTVDDARGSCEEHGGHLAYILNRETNTFLEDMVFNKSDKYWIGLHFVHESYKHRWFNGKPLVFRNWNSGEPNNVNRNELCVELSGNGKWNDIPCSEKRGYFCQANVTYPQVIKSCPKGWTLFNQSDQCFQIFSQRRTVDVARGICQKNGGHLAYIPDNETSTFLIDMAMNTGSNHWIGLHFLHDTRQFQWFNGKKAIFKNWNDGEPNNAGRNEHCVELTQNGKWNDIVCNQFMGFFCQATVTYYPAKVACPGGWSLNKKHFTCLKAFISGKNWNNARQTCKTYQGDLAVIPDKDSNEVVKGSLKKKSHSHWIGLNDKEREGTYRWLGSNTKLVFSNLVKVNQGTFKHQDDCGVFLQDGTWNIADCSTLNGFICEIKAFVYN